MPRFLLPGGHAFETVDNDRFNFDVEIAMPLVGSIVAYRGWLQPDFPAK